MLAERKRNLDTCAQAYGIDSFETDEAQGALFATYANVAASALIDQTVLNTVGLNERLPFQDKSFGLVTSSLVLHKLSSDFRIAALQEIMRVCLPGGYVVILDLSHYVGSYAKMMRSDGWAEVKTSWAGLKVMLGTVPCTVLRARKPAGAE